MTPVRRVWGLLLVAVVVVVVLAGCKVDAEVDVTLRADGSGTIAARVALDADAVARLTTHVPLACAVPLGDLRAAGWKVSPWSRAKGGEAVTLTHGFVGQADLERRITDLAGASGALRDARIVRTRGWFGAKDAISIAVDLRHLSAGVRSDAQLAKNLAAAGVDVKTLDAQLRSQLDQALLFTVTVHAPGGQSKTVQLTAGGHATAAAASAQTYTRRRLLMAIGTLLVLVALLLTTGSLVSTSRRRRRS